MSNSNCSLTRTLLLQKLEHRSIAKSRPDVRNSTSNTSNFPSLSIENSKSIIKINIDEEQQITLPPKTRKNIRMQLRQSSVPIAEKKFVFRKLSISKAPEKKMNSVMSKTLSSYFQYRPISFINVFGKRDQYMFSLRSRKREIQPAILNPLQLKHKLQQFFEKDYRNKGPTSEYEIQEKRQLIPQSQKKKNKQQQQDIVQQEEEYDESSNISDLVTWKRRNGVGSHQKVFIVKGGYEYLRKALLDRGWVQNEDVWSPFFDLKWTTKIYDINFSQLGPDQMVNHFNSNQGLISKSGLAQSLRILAVKQRVDVNKFFPRCFDLTLQGQVQDFIQNFKFTFAQSVLNKYVAQPIRYKGLQLKVRIAIKVSERRLTTFKQKMDSVNNGNFFFISPSEWSVLTQIDQLTEQQKSLWLKQITKDQPTIDRQSEDFQQNLEQYLHQIIQQKLSQLRQIDSQSKLSGHHNVWIVKPNFLSRGRGIHCFNNLFQICNYCFGKDLGFVVQKYIERPLLLQGRKFDIRQWVLIEGFNPPKIWVYEQCYLRFCAQTYSLDNIYNRFVHLTNNSIQKNGNKFDKSTIPGNMWGLQQFANRIGENNWKTLKQKIIDVIVLSVKSAEPTIAPRRNSFELVGYDFMVDESFNPWLIEVNMSPAMDYSTKVTQRLVKKVLTDTAKVIVDKKGKDTGLFKCVYSGGKYKSPFYSLQ